jgi:NADPH:quinone reductase
MKAIRVHEFGPPSVMRLEEVPDPEPGPGEVLVEVKAAGVNPLDTYIRSGSYTPQPALPYTPGFDGAGVVRSLGPDVTTVAPLDRVYITGTIGQFAAGTYAELALCHASQVKPLPQTLTFAQGAAVNIPYAAAYRALFHKARAAPGERVLVHGASGGAGIAAVQLATAFGLTVIGTAGTEQGRQLIHKQGAHHVLDHTAPDYLEAVEHLTDGRGVNVIIEHLASVNLDKDLKVLANHGRVVIVGSRGPDFVEINLAAAMPRDAEILAMQIWNTPPAELESIHAALIDGLANGTLRPVVDQEFPLEEAVQAHEVLLTPGRCGKIVVIPGGLASTVPLLTTEAARLANPHPGGMTSDVVGLHDLPPQLRSRIMAATAHAQHRCITPVSRRHAAEGYEVHAIAGDRFVHMVLALRPDGSVHEATETLLRNEIRRVEIQGDQGTIYVEHPARRGSIAVPLPIAAALREEK